MCSPRALALVRREVLHADSLVKQLVNLFEWTALRYTSLQHQRNESRVAAFPYDPISDSPRYLETPTREATENHPCWYFPPGILVRLSSIPPPPPHAKSPKALSSTRLSASVISSCLRISPWRTAPPACGPSASSPRPSPAAVCSPYPLFPIHCKNDFSAPL